MNSHPNTNQKESWGLFCLSFANAEVEIAPNKKIEEIIFIKVFIFPPQESIIIKYNLVKRFTW